MIEHLLHDYWHWKLMWWGGGLLLAAVVISFAYAVWTRRQKERQELDIKRLLSVPDLENSMDSGIGGKRAGQSVDTLFILPDISNYTRFVSNKHLTSDDAQDIIFSLMSAIINSVGDDLRFSKLEGDSALFYIDGEAASAGTVGATFDSIFAAFDRRKADLYSELSRDPEAQRSVDALDLKIFAHRGVAQRFTYRGVVDHFGSEVTLVHKLMKNGIKDTRYVLVTNAAKPLVLIGDQYDCEPLKANVEHIGAVRGHIYRPTERPENAALDTKIQQQSRAARPAKYHLPPSVQNVLGLINTKWNMTMKLKTLIAAAAMTLAATVAFADDFTKGTIKKIEAKSGKVTVKHEELKNLGMPAMTMVFRAKDDEMLKKLKEGQNIQFVAERVKGKLTLVELK